MEILGPIAGSMRETLTGLRSSFPGMSSDEWDAFALGYWAGAMALGISLDDQSLNAGDVGRRVEVEIQRIEERSAR